MFRFAFVGLIGNLHRWRFEALSTKLVWIAMGTVPGPVGSASFVDCVDRMLPERCCGIDDGVGFTVV